MANTFKILRSVGNTAPTGLEQGELAYVEASGTGDGRLYIGAAGSTVEVVGGQYFIDLLNSYDPDLATFTLPANTAMTAYGRTVVQAVDSAANTALLDLATITVKGLLPTLSNNAAQYLNGTGAWTVPAGGGDVSFNAGTAPADNALVRFDGVTGQLIQESGIIIDDSENVTGMGTLNGKTIANLVSTTDTGSATWTWIIDDDSMATASATTVPTSESVKAYVDSTVSGAMTYKGGYNAATNTPDLDTTPIATAIGDFYTVTAAGTFFTVAVEVGDSIIAEVVNATTEADWTIVNRNIDQATESVAGIAAIATSGEVTTGTNDTKFVTPLKLEGWNGSTNIASVGTITAGTWQGDAIGSAYMTNASETVLGIIEIATQAEVDAGASALLAVTPSYLHNTTFDAGTF